MLVLKFLLLIFSMMLGYFGGYLFTETKFYLAKYQMFQFKAFECRKCLSFHISWFTSTLIGLLFNSWTMVIIGIIFAFSLFFALWIDEKNKTVSTEEYDERINK